ncbi:hypothetical protein HC931_07635 [Candidatus Gracilibacteria bacterium]|nr:hypothetical protein [Candidatus Gracilibacteria bacterium]NJM89149.1 hypothetical protein [Hydrococcus sp. RU_2_2]NJP20972.1 hypothetical protein [Hydrococcus sp. CRU_1_1]
MTTEEREWAIEELDNWYNIQLTKEQLDCVLIQSPLVIVQIKIDCDTVAREHLIKAIAKYLGFKEYPTYSTPDEEVEKFVCEFLERAKLAGFLIRQEQ